MRTVRAKRPIPSASDPSTGCGRLWTPVGNALSEFAQLALPRYPLPLFFPIILTAAGFSLETGIHPALEVLERRHGTRVVERQQLRGPHAGHPLHRIDPVIGVGEPAPGEA